MINSCIALLDPRRYASPEHKNDSERSCVDLAEGKAKEKIRVRLGLPLHNFAKNP